MCVFVVACLCLLASAAAAAGITEKMCPYMYKRRTLAATGVAEPAA